MRSTIARSLLLLTTPLCLSLVGCSDSGTSDAAAPFGGSGGQGGNAGGNGGSAAATVGGNGGSGNGGSGNGGSGNGGSGNGSSGGSSNAGSGGSGGSGAGPQDAGIPDVVFTYDAPVIVEEACAATRIEADPIPVDMYIVLDKSGSMGSDCNVGSSTNSKWCHAVNALDGFFNASSSVGMGVALGYFGATGCTGTTVSVALDTLPAHTGALRSSLNNTNPSDGSTNTRGALLGIVNHTTLLQRAGRQMIGILVTDGAPNGCGSSSNTDLNNIVRNHFNATGIPTFIVGMTGAAFGNLEAWAGGAGGTLHSNFCGSGAPNPCLSYDVGGGDPTAFIQALQQIQKAAIGCTFNIPTPPSGIPDITKIKVIYSSGANSEDLVRVDNAGACGSAPSGTGWYFNDNVNPTQILLCADSCTRVSGDQNAQIDVEIPCLGS